MNTHHTNTCTPQGVFSGLSSDMTLADFLRALWRARFFVVFGALVGLACAALFLVWAVPHYRVTMLVAPAERAGKTDIKALLPDNPSFALQYLINTMGSQDSTDFALFENMLRAPRVAEGLMRDPAIVVGMARPGRFLFSADHPATNGAELSAQMEKRILIIPVGNTPLRRVTIEHASPQVGKAILSRIYDETDRLMRQDVALTAKKRIAYLNDMLTQVNHPDHRRALTALLMEQEHILMLLAMDEPFAAMIAEPPAATPRPVWPRRGLVLMIFALIGAGVGFTVWGLRPRRC